jgi:4-hydroxy-tetrahydrodipicolinate reductase
MANPIRLAVLGATGRMGRSIIDLARQDKRFALYGQISRRNRRDLAETLAQSDVAIDFSLPAATLGFAKAAVAAHVPLVIGTTGLKSAQTKSLKALARRSPILLAPNMSPGMNLLFALAQRAAAALPGYDAIISETHHTRKIDAPSGSAKRLASSVSEARGGGKVATVSLRAGEVIGDHTLTLAGPDERLELTHRAQDRTLFVRGALDAALWLRKKRRGFFTMQDVLGL